MIVKMAHITICVNNIDIGYRYARELGYKPSFESRKIKNPQNKKMFMDEYSTYHDLALFQKSNSIPLEFVSYSQNKKTSSLFKIGINPDITAKIRTPQDFDAFSSISTLSKQFLPYKLNSPTQIIKMTTNNLSNTIFWGEFFGFKLIEPTEKQNYHTMLFSSYNREQNFFLQIKEAKNYNDASKLDYLGGRAIAFITTSLEKDISKARKISNWKTSDIEKININGKELSIAFIQGSQGELVELINI